MDEKKAKLIGELREVAVATVMCGSMVTCDPVPEGTDEDWLVYTNGGVIAECVHEILEGYGFAIDKGDYHPCEPSDFVSWKPIVKTDGRPLNFIVTPSRVWYERHQLATAVCKRLNLLNKADRIAVFQGILYDNWKG